MIIITISYLISYFSLGYFLYSYADKNGLIEFHAKFKLAFMFLWPIFFIMYLLAGLLTIVSYADKNIEKEATNGTTNGTRND